MDVGKQAFYDLIFASFERNFCNFPLDSDIWARTSALGRQQTQAAERGGWSWVHPEQTQSGHRVSLQVPNQERPARLAGTLPLSFLPN